MTSFSSFNPFLQLHRFIRLGRLKPWLLCHGHARALLRTEARLPLLAVLLMLSLVVTVNAAAAAVLEEVVVVVVGKRRLSRPSRHLRLSLRQVSSVDSHVPQSTESLQARWGSCATIPPAAAAAVVVVVVVLAAVLLEELVRVLVLVVLVELMAVPTTLVKTTARLQGTVGRILAFRSCGSTLCRTALSHFVSTGGVSQPQPTVAMVVVVVVTLALCVHHTMISLAVRR